MSKKNDFSQKGLPGAAVKRAVPGGKGGEARADPETGCKTGLGSGRLKALLKTVLAESQRGAFHRLRTIHNRTGGNAEIGRIPPGTRDTGDQAASRVPIFSTGA